MDPSIIYMVAPLCWFLAVLHMYILSLRYRYDDGEDWVEATLDALQGNKATITLTSNGKQVQDVSLEYLVRK